MGKKILFWPDVYKEQGHWLPTFVWAKDLYNLGHTVAYMGIPDCSSLVNSFCPDDNDHTIKVPYYTIFSKLYPLGYTDASHSSPEGRWKPEHVLRIESGALNLIFSGENKPDLLISGYFTSLESLLIHKLYGVKVIITTTYLRHPENDPAMRAIQNMMAYNDSFHSRRNFFINRRNQIPRRESYFDAYTQDLSSFHELIPCPQEFDYKHYKHGAKVHYVEPCMTPSLEHATSGNDIDWNTLIAGYSKIIFATAGSQVLDYEKKAEHLFDCLIQMMDAPQMQGYHLVLGVGEKLLRSRKWTENDNITVAGWVPQRQLLSSGHVSCAVIHGGLATIKECIFYGVDFVIAPLGKDQMDNAIRLKENGINNMLDIETSDAGCFLYYINKVKTDYQMKKNLSKLQKAFVKAELEKKGLGVILSVLNS